MAPILSVKDTRNYDALTSGVILKTEIAMSSKDGSVSQLAEVPNALPRDVFKKPVCVVHSRHPLALHTIRSALSGNKGLTDCIRPYCGHSSKPEKWGILLLDTCSVDNWSEALEKWQSASGRSVLLISSEMQNEAKELQMVHLGANGILAFSDDLHSKLPRVVRAVADGALWIRRDVLNEYVRQTTRIWRRILCPDRRLTARERQTVELLLRGYSNREIAHVLGVSERTAKFHVSNVLQKFEVESRHELLVFHATAVRNMDVSHKVEHPVMTPQFVGR